MRRAIGFGLHIIERVWDNGGFDSSSLNGLEPATTIRTGTAKVNMAYPASPLSSPSSTVCVPPATRIFHYGRSFKLLGGGCLDGMDIAYETWGRLSARRDNAVLIFTGLSPSAHATAHPEDASPGWWEFMVGPGKPVDTDRFFVICINSLGSCFGSSGPASINPTTGEPYRLTFPELAVEDIADTGFLLLRELGIQRAKAVIGTSLGGMSGLAFSVRHPDALENMVSVCGAARATPFAIAVRSLQREMIRSDPAWQGGDYALDAEPVMGMRLARKLGLISYRSAREWDHRFGRQRCWGPGETPPPFGIEFEVESYLEANANKFVGTFDANAYLYLSRAMDRFDVSAGRGSAVDALAGAVRISRALVIGVETDFLFPLEQQREIARGLEQGGAEVEFHPLPSVQGHDAFLVDAERFVPPIARFFDSLY